MTDQHVLPINDLREHVETRDCWCGPRVEVVHEDGCPAIADDESDEVLYDYGVCVCAGNAVVVHHSLDGRELIEQHGVN